MTIFEFDRAASTRDMPEMTSDTNFIEQVGHKSCAAAEPLLNDLP